MNFIKDKAGNIYMSGSIIGRDFGNDIYTDEAIQDIETLMTNLTAFDCTNRVKDFIQTEKTNDWIREFQNTFKENTMQPDNLAQHHESVRMAGKIVTKMKIVTSGINIQDAINNAYIQLESIAKNFGADLPSNHQVPMTTTDGTTWQVAQTGTIGIAANTTCSNWPPATTVTTNGTHQYPSMNMFPRKEQLGSVGLYDTLESIPGTPVKGIENFTLHELLGASGGIPDLEAQLEIDSFHKTLENTIIEKYDVTPEDLATQLIQWYPNPIDLQEADKEKTEPLVEKFAAWHWLEQGKMCTNGHFDLHPTNIDTLHAYDSNSGARVFLSTQADKRDRHRELKEFSYELQDISVVEKDYMALDNPEWTEI